MLQDRVPRAVRASPTRFGAELTRPGKAAGRLFGGNLELLACTVGVLDCGLDTERRELIFSPAVRDDRPS